MSATTEEARGANRAGTLLRENLTVFVLIGVLIVVIVQIATRQVGLEKRLTTAEGKLDRIENWIVSDRQIQAERHEDVMKVLSGINVGQAKTVTAIEFIKSYYERAERR